MIDNLPEELLIQIQQLAKENNHMEEAVDLTISHKISAYEAAYVVLSRRVNAPLLTLDKN